MRSPDRLAAASAMPIVIVAGFALIVLAIAAVLLLQSHAVPPAVLDGLTFPAGFGPRTT